MQPPPKPKDAQKEAFNALNHSLKELVGKTWEIEEAVRNVGPDSAPALQERMTQYISSVTDLRNQTAPFDGIRVPLDLLQYVDDGGNVNQYTAEVFKACVRDNQASKGKVEAVQSLWDSVVAKMEQDLPEQAEAYRSLIANSGQVVRPSVLSPNAGKVWPPPPSGAPGGEPGGQQQQQPQPQTQQS